MTPDVIWKVLHVKDLWTDGSFIHIDIKASVSITVLSFPTLITVQEAIESSENIRIFGAKVGFVDGNKKLPVNVNCHMANKI